MTKPLVLISRLAYALFVFATPNLSAQSEVKEPLPSTVFDWKTRVETPTPVGIYRGVTDRPTATLERFECHITTLHQGNESHPPHQHPQEEFIILQEGELDVYINGETKRVGPGSLFFFASYDWHAVHNVGEGPATYLVFNYESEETKQVRRQPAAEWAPESAQPSNVFPWPWKDKSGPQPNKSHEFFNAPTVTLQNLRGTVASIKPGKSAKHPKRVPTDQILAVKEGEIRVTINGVESTIGRGSIVFISSNDEHTIHNVGDVNAVYYAFSVTTEKTPAS